MLNASSIISLAELIRRMVDIVMQGRKLMLRMSFPFEE